MVVARPRSGDTAHPCALALAEPDARRPRSLRRASRRTGRSAGLDAPLFFVEDEFRASLDAFPLEFSEIIAHAPSRRGADLFADVIVPSRNLRRACEAQASGHVLHLREGYHRGRRRPKAVAEPGRGGRRLAAVPRAGSRNVGAGSTACHARRRCVTASSLDNFARQACARARLARDPASIAASSFRVLAAVERLRGGTLATSDGRGATGRCCAPLRSWRRAGCRRLWRAIAPRVRAAAAAGTHPAGQRLRGRHRCGERARDRAAHPRAAAGQRATSWSSPRSRRSQPYADIREYAVKMFENRGRGIGAEGQGQRPPGPARREGSRGLGRSRLRPRAVHHRRLRRRDQP